MIPDNIFKHYTFMFYIRDINGNLSGESDSMYLIHDLIHTCCERC